MKHGYAETEPSNDAQDKIDVLEGLLDDPETKDALSIKMGEM